MQSNVSEPTDFVERSLPWILAGGALVLYLVTLNPWVTFESLSWVAKVTGWDWWSVNLQAPVFYLMTYPVRWLPGAVQPLALNLFSAVCAALALGWLARSVSLLPHDRTRDQRHRERSVYALLSLPVAWVPPVLAVMACGLQFSLWKHATAMTGESLNLLLFAFCVRCLLEYRLDQRESWLNRLALVYGLGVTNNWAMIGFFPFFVGALAWIRGLRFFQSRFVIRMLGWGCLGLSLFLVLPLIEWSNNSTDYSFWMLLKTQLVWQKNALLSFPRYIALVCGLTSILPVMVMGVRWPSSIGDLSVLSNLVTNVMFRIMHVLFCVVCLWVMFDPPFSPRARGLGLAMLPFYYLSALAVGYFAGYFLLVFGKSPSSRREPKPIWEKFTNPVLLAAVWLALVAVPAGLAYRNYPDIRALNQPHLRQLADNLLKCLPSRPSFLLSDDRATLLLLEARQAGKAAAERHVSLDSTSMPFVSYHRLLAERYGKQWPLSQADLRNASGATLPYVTLGNLVAFLASSNQLYYLHPSFGYYFEAVYPEPNGLVQRLLPFSSDQVVMPDLNAGEIAANQSFWNQAKTKLPGLVSDSQSAADGIPVGETPGIAAFYSRAANYWGFRLQQSNQRLKEAESAFQLALRFNPSNYCAQVNLEVNQWLQNGERQSFVLSDNLKSRFPQYYSWQNLLNSYGPCDGADNCARLGQAFAVAKPEMLRQSAQCYLRAARLDPTNAVYPLTLANLMIQLRQPDQALEKLKMLPPSARLVVSNQVACIRLEALVQAVKSNFTGAAQMLVSAQQKYPREKVIPETLAMVYLRVKDYSNALAVTEQLLRLDPNSTQGLLNKSAFCIQLNQYSAAIPPLNHLLEAIPNLIEARLNRAIAYLQSGQLDLARQDYDVYLKLVPNNFRAYYGLAEIAYRQKQSAQAIEYYRKYIDSAPRNYQRQPLNPTEFGLATNRLNELRAKSGTP